MEPPRRPARKLYWMVGATPLAKCGRNPCHWQHASIQGLDNQVVSLRVCKFVLLVRDESLSLCAPEVAHPTDCSPDQSRKVALDERRVLSGQLHFARKRQIVADKNARAGCER